MLNGTTSENQSVATKPSDGDRKVDAVTETPKTTPINRLKTNQPHQLTRDGVDIDKPVEDRTAEPERSKMKFKQTAQVTSPAPTNTRSHELTSFIGRTVRLELKRPHEVRSVAFISNKGGVGKTHTSTNMAFYLSRLGKKVLLIDLDLGNSDVTNKLGFYCENTILDLLKGTRIVNQLIYTTPHGFDLIGGESGNVKLANLNAAQKKRFIRALRELGNDYDYVLYDLSAGINSTTLDFALAQDFQMIVTTPQDIVAGYSCIKAAYYRFQEIENKMAERDPGYKQRRTFRPFVIMNQVSEFDSGRELYDKISNVAKNNIRGDKNYYLDINFLGVITADQIRIRESELQHFLYSGQYGASRTGQCYNFLAENLTQYRDPNNINFTTKLKRFISIFMRSVEETKYAR